MDESVPLHGPSASSTLIIKQEQITQINLSVFNFPPGRRRRPNTER